MARLLSETNPIFQKPMWSFLLAIGLLVVVILMRKIKMTAQRGRGWKSGEGSCKRMGRVVLGEEMSGNGKGGDSG